MSATLLQRINAVRKAVEYIKKEKAVQNYKAVTHDQVTAMVRDHLVEHGVVIFPNLISSVTVATGEATSKGTPIIRVEAVYEFTFVNVDDSSDKFTASVSAHANDQGDKAPGKALSYAKKAAILKVFEIESGEDDESRFNADGMDDDDLVKHLDAINAAVDEAKLKEVFTPAFRAAGDDKQAQKIIIRAKDARKAALAKAA